jgi:hypothetical protein
MTYRNRFAGKTALVTGARHGHRRADRKRREDLEPQLEDLLGDPILGLLMGSDGVSRTDLERIIDDARQRLAPPARSTARTAKE